MGLNIRPEFLHKMLSNVAHPKKRESQRFISKHTRPLAGFNGIIHIFTSKHTLLQSQMVSYLLGNFTMLGHFFNQK